MLNWGGVVLLEIEDGDVTVTVGHLTVKVGFVSIACRTWYARAECVVEHPV